MGIAEQNTGTFRNIAPLAQAWQSSYSRWSHGSGEASWALVGRAPDGYAFHTQNGAREYWAADLQKLRAIAAIRIFKRNGQEETIKAADLEIKISSDMESWISLGSPTTAGRYYPYELECGNIHGRYIKIITRHKYLYARQIEILVNDLVIPFRNVNMLKFPFMGSGIIDQLADGYYEHHEIDMALASLSADDKIIELGSSIGGVANVINKSIRPAAYCCLEANGQLVSASEANRELNGLNFEIIHGAIGEGTEADFLVHANFLKSSLAPVPNPVRIEKIPLFTLEKLIAKYAANVLIVDVEGAEYAIFNDAAALNAIEKICIEIHAPTREKIYELINFLSYAGLNLRTPESVATPQCVLFFTREA